MSYIIDTKQVKEEEVKLTRSELKTYNEMYNLYYAKVVSFIFYTLESQGSRYDAEDITQTAFIKAAKKFDTYNEKKGKINTWLYNIAKNAMIDFLRAKNVRFAAKPMIGEDEIIENRNISNFPTDKNVLSNELSEKIEIAFEKLSPMYKEIANLFFIKEYTLSEISEMLAMPLNTVKVNIHRCRKEMQKSLKRTHLEYAS